MTTNKGTAVKRTAVKRSIESIGAIGELEAKLKEESDRAMQLANEAFEWEIYSKEIKLGHRAEARSRQFFAGLTPGELLESTGLVMKRGVHTMADHVSDYFEWFRGVAPGDILMYLGMVEPPGETVTLRTEAGREKQLQLYGPKWLINGTRLEIIHLPLGILRPVVIEVDNKLVEMLEEVASAQNCSRASRTLRKPSKRNKGKQKK